MLGPIYALFVKDIGGDILDASFAGAVYALAAGLTTLISGKYFDKIKENELIVVLGYVIIGFGFLLLGTINSILSLLIIQIIIGLGEAIYSPAFDAVYSKHLDGKKSGSQWGTWESMNYFTMSVGAVIGGLVVTVAGFKILFIIMTLMAFSSALYIYLLPRKVL